MAAVEGLLHRAVDGRGAVVTVVGPPGIGKSRLVREVTALADAEGVEAFSAVCESHTTQVPFHAVARLLRAATDIEGLDLRRPGHDCRGLLLTLIPKIYCSSRTCWASVIPTSSCRRSIRMRGDGG